MRSRRTEKKRRDAASGLDHSLTASENAASRDMITFRDYVDAARQIGAAPEEREQFYQSWQGKRVEWEGRIKRIERFGHSDRLALVVACGRLREDLLAACLFPEDMQEKLAALRPRQSVRFSGIVQDQDPAYVYLRACKLQESAPSAKKRKSGGAQRRPPRPRRTARSGFLTHVWRMVVELGRAN